LIKRTGNGAVVYESVVYFWMGRNFKVLILICRFTDLNGS